ncbi:MAG TPA: DUF481 domain-containing protein [Candidatus Acidoferrales bacterium]|nr:DUF481 domain-containing protein [Candidatus Acidoferrales bacterium]
MRNVFVLLFVLAFALPAFADQVTLDNGDRVTGAIVKTDAKTLVIKTDYAGDVTVKWTAVVSIQSDEELYVGLAGGQVVAGPVSMTDGKIAVQTKDEGTVTSTKDAVQFIRDDAEQTAYAAREYRLEHPRLVDFWNGFVDAGLSTTRGNSSTLSFTVDGKAIRTTDADIFTVYFNSILTKSSVTGPTLTTAHSIVGGLRGDFNITPRFFMFGTTDFQYDELEKLDLRNTLGGGAGLHVLKTKQTLFDVYGGADYSQAYYSTGVSQRSAEINLGENVSYQASSRTLLAEQLDLFPNVSDIGQFRMTLNASAATTIAHWLAWQVAVGDRYVSNPIPGIKSNDFVLTTGIRVTFGKASI